MNDPLFYHRLATGVGMQHAAVREPTRYLAFFDPPPERRALARLCNGEPSLIAGITREVMRAFCVGP
jgi:hypothetical protein